MFNKIKAIPWRGWTLPILLLIVWQWFSGYSDVYAYIFVPLQTVAITFYEIVLNGDLWINFRSSLGSTLLGLSIGVAIGLITGTLMAIFLLVDRLVGPIYHSIRQVPILGLIPLIGLWFGNGDQAKILVISLAAFYPTVLNTYEGIRNAERRYLEVATVLTLTTWQVFNKILLPSALPRIITGITYAMAFAWLSCMGSELLFTTGPGLGALLINGETAGKMDVVIICVLTIALIGYSMNSIFRWLAGFLVRRPSRR